MIRSSLVKSACVAIALSGFSPPQAGAIEMQGSNPTAQLGEGLMLKVYVTHRAVTSTIAAGPLAAIAAAMATAAGFIAAGSTAEGMAAGPGPAGIAGARGARSRPARPSACSPQEPPWLTRGLRPRRDCAGTTPTQVTGRGSGTPASTFTRLGRGPAWAPRNGGTAGLLSGPGAPLFRRAERAENSAPAERCA